MSEKKKLRIEQVRSVIGSTPGQRAVLGTLGLRRIRAVVTRGRLLTRAALDSLLAEAETKAAAGRR